MLKKFPRIHWKTPNNVLWAPGTTGKYSVAFTLLRRVCKTLSMRLCRMMWWRVWSKEHAFPLNLRSYSQVMAEVIATVYSGTSGQRLRYQVIFVQWSSSSHRKTEDALWRTCHTKAYIHYIFDTSYFKISSQDRALRPSACLENLLC